jgi:crotonobetainyl-CoA:carnitine CoA-transferase CaiB-like acyl-CoA transferase
VHHAAELVDDPQFVARTQLVEHEHPQAGSLRLVGTPIRSTEASPRLRPAPAQGADTHEVLRDVLGYDDARIAALRARGVLGAPDVEERGGVGDRRDQ